MEIVLVANTYLLKYMPNFVLQFEIVLDKKYKKYSNF